MINQERTCRPADGRPIPQSDRKRPYLFILSWAAIMLTCCLCGPASARAATVTLSATPASRTINQGQTTTYTININRDNFNGSVTLSATNLPAGATASLSPNPTTGKSSILTVTTKTTTPAGTFQIKVAGLASGISIAPINVTLIVRLAPNVTMTVTPLTQSIIAGQAADYSIKLNRTNYDGPVTLAATLPDGMTASFEPNPVSGNNSRMRIYSHRLPFVTRDYDITISIRELQLPGVRVYARVNCGVNWAEQFGTGSNDFAEDVAVASDGTIYVTGNRFNPDNNSRDAWVAKFNGNGFLIWLERLETDGDDFGTEVAVDTSGNVFVGGYTDGTMPNNLPVGHNDFWIAKYDNAGNRQWVKQGGTQMSDGMGNSQQDGKGGFEIVPDNQGGGELTTFENERSVIATYSFASTDGALTRQSNLNHSLDTFYQDGANDLTVGPNGEVYVVGKFTDESDPNMPHDQGYLIKFDRQGTNDVWRKTIQNPSSQSDEEALRVIADATGAFVYVAATTDRAGNTDAWLIQYESDGDQGWFKEENSPGDDFINALAFNNDHDLITAGKTNGVLGEINGGNFDAWVARRGAVDGNLKWVRQFAVSDKDSFNAVAIAGNNDLILAGDALNFRTNLGFEDALLMRYADGWSLFSPFISATNPFTPSSGPVGATIRINGGNFFNLTGIRFNGVPAAPIPVSSTAVDAVVPQGADDGLVTVSGGCNSSSSTMQFDVQ